MEANQRNHIINNIERLIQITNYDELIEAIRRAGLIDQKELDLIEDIDPTVEDNEQLLEEDERRRRERHRQLFVKVTHQGPAAYKHLKRILYELTYITALELLNELGEDENAYQSLRNSHNANNGEVHTYIDGNAARTQRCSLCPDTDTSPQLTLAEYAGEIKPSKFHVRAATVIRQCPKTDTYTMKSENNRGVLMVVNIIDFQSHDSRRSGSDLDADGLLHLYKQMGFRLFYYTNLSANKFNELLDKLLQSEYTRHAECFVLALMTHGDMRGNMEYVEFSDGSVLNVHLILQKFTQSNCPNLIFKPKLFLFPFCRGEAQDLGFYLHMNTDGCVTKIEGEENPRTHSIHTMQDMLICYAAVPGYRTHRDPNKGSWYIQKYCEKMAEYAHDTHFETILKLIQKDTAKLRTEGGGMQMGTYINLGFNRKLFFNPGIWE